MTSASHLKMSLLTSNYTQPIFMVNYDMEKKIALRKESVACTLVLHLLEALSCYIKRHKLGTPGQLIAALFSDFMLT